MEGAQRIGYCLIGVVSLLGFLSIPAQLIERTFAPETIVEPALTYLPIPGRRHACPDTDKQGRKYNGYFAAQADSSTARMRVTCHYL